MDDLMTLPGNVITKIFRSVKTERPEIVCLCGSSRFYAEYQQAYYDLTMQGHIVLSVGFYPHAKAEHGHGEGVGHDSVQKIELDELHKRKIDLADWVYVLNVGRYIGSSTREEIRYAQKYGKEIRYLDPLIPSELVDGTIPDGELPGMWESADFAGGPDDVTSQRLWKSYHHRTGDNS